MSKNDPQIRIRLPEQLKAWIEEEAAKYSGSINGEVVRALLGHKERVEKSRAKRADRASA
jgi:Arc/MetJ-type ribon-helix-helix transcriptional regulator